MVKWLAVVIFAVGAIFWAGAAYQRIANIENRLADIQKSLADVAEIKVLKNQAEDFKLRLERIEGRERRY